MKYLGILIVSIEYLIKLYHIKRDSTSRCRTNCITSSKRKTSRAGIANLKFVDEGNDCIYARYGRFTRGIAVSSAVDVDKWLRKEVDMECVTPSQPVPILPGESLNIEGVLEKTEEVWLRNTEPSASVVHA
jgi:DNA polymerase gamma 1